MFDAFGISALIAVLYISFIVIYSVLKRKTINVPRFCFINLGILYVILLVTTTQLTVGGQTKTSNFIPFVNILLKTSNGYVFHVGHFFRYLTTSLLNIILFVPFGFFVATIFYAMDKRINVLIIAILALIISGVVESLQLILPANRIFDVDDLVYNTIGGILGTVVFIILRKNVVFKKFINNILER